MPLKNAIDELRFRSNGCAETLKAVLAHHPGPHRRFRRREDERSSHRRSASSFSLTILSNNSSIQNLISRYIPSNSACSTFPAGSRAPLRAIYRRSVAASRIPRFSLSGRVMSFPSPFFRCLKLSIAAPYHAVQRKLLLFRGKMRRPRANAA